MQAQVTEYLINQSPEEDAGYLMKYGFDQWQLEEIDTDYVFKVTSAISRYEEELIEKVNQNTQTSNMSRWILWIRYAFCRAI